MKERIWDNAQAEVKRLMGLMPESHRSRIREVSDKKFSAAVAEITSVRERFGHEDSVQQQEYLARRYVYLWKTLLINVSLNLIGSSRSLSFGDDALQKENPQ